MKVKTSELRDEALDWAIATCKELPIMHDPMGFKTGSEAGYWIWPDGPTAPMGQKIGRNFSPSTKWDQGGPIIEREGIEVGPAPGSRPVGKLWLAEYPCNPESKKFRSHGPTPLIAAMRCYAASKLGDEIDIPNTIAPRQSRADEADETVAREVKESAASPAEAPVPQAANGAKTRPKPR